MTPIRSLLAVTTKTSSIISHPMKVLNYLSDENLLKVFSQKSKAILIKDYISKQVCDEVSQKIRNLKGKELQPIKIGTAYHETGFCEGKKRAYFDEALATNQLIRKLFLPYISPIDLIRIDCDEVWPSGAMLLKDHRSRPMMFGLIKSLEKGEEILPHEDKLERNDQPRVRNPLWGQLAFHLYLESHDLSGRLELWNKSYSDTEYARLINSRGKLHRAKIGAPDEIIYPQKGDLVLFNARNVHALSKLNSSRLSIFGFIGLETPSSPLKFWS